MDTVASSKSTPSSIESKLEQGLRHQERIGTGHGCNQLSTATSDFTGPGDDDVMVRDVKEESL